MSRSRTKQPNLVCHSCGTKFCTTLPSSRTSYYVGDCECCGAKRLPVTDPISYGGFKVWPLPVGEDPIPLPSCHADLVPLVLADFDFDKVAKMMAAVNWKWVIRDSAGSFGIPGVYLIKEVSERLLREVAASQCKDTNAIATGGLRATKSDDGLELEFIAASVDYHLSDFS